MNKSVSFPYWLGQPWIDNYKERAWYDNHRFALAPEADEAQIFDDIVKGTVPKANKRGTDPGLTTKNITKLMNPTLWKAMDDSETVGSILAVVFHSN